ncbi:MAG: ABC transporter ATP-binding protein [Pseudomonadota bacterium]
MADPVIDIRDLSVGFTARAGHTQEVLKSVSIYVKAGETLGIVGESGSGKSTLALASMGYMKPGLRKLKGDVLFEGREVFDQSLRQLEGLRGGKLGLIPQSSGQALTPTMRIGAQVQEALRLHCNLSAAECSSRAEALLNQVRLPDVPAIMKRFPHELSGGQQQRVAIAMALAGEPDALVLDEPTTGLDVTTQKQILDLVQDLARERNMAMMLVSHDLGVIARCCHRVAVMYQGEIVLEGPSKEVLKKPKHPYAQQLIDAVPRIQKAKAKAKKAAPATSEALNLEDVGICYSQPGFWEKTLGNSTPRALTVDGINISLGRGKTIGLVGESGSGKSTILKAIAGLLPAQKGTIRVGGDTLLKPSIDRRRPEELRRVQMIFQNPDDSLNPRHTVAEILAQPLQLYFGKTGRAARDRAAELLDTVRLTPAYLDRLPRQMSGGEKQRVAIARAFAAEPEIVLCDEITSALDVSVQASVLELLADLKQQKQTSYVFVGHDLAVVQQLSDQVMVLRHGRVCEAGPVDQVYANPQSDYTKTLFDAVLEPGNA